MTHLNSSPSPAIDAADSPPKSSAQGVARFRALHQILDAPLIFEDPLAGKILGPREEEALPKDKIKYDTPLFKGLRASVVARSRLAEDLWRDARRQGVTQYVMLGAGLDTYAYRHPEPDGCDIFEVDLPATQQWKRARLREVGLPEAASVRYVPCDFERSSLLDALEKGGFRKQDPAFFAWLGVTMYLEEGAVFDTLRPIAALPQKSAVVFDFAVSPALLSKRERLAMEALAARTTERGEPWKSSFVPDALRESLSALGFSRVEFYSGPRLNELYFAKRTDGLHKSGVSAIMYAGV